VELTMITSARDGAPARFLDNPLARFLSRL